ncbi:hypothetical protein C8J56DRAFT_1058331 [Mycena floridula]|nr:hypothetical protein C8J56DRAFT_1058331 [Mycena floridula]
MFMVLMMITMLQLLANSASTCCAHSAQTIIGCLLRTRWTPDLRHLLEHLAPVPVVPGPANQHDDLSADDDLPALVSLSIDGSEDID